MFTFHNPANAFRFADRAHMVVILGDCPEYWVVTPADAERLQAQGYEVAK